MARHVLLTGFTGFIGRRVAAALLRDGTPRVSCLVRRESLARARARADELPGRERLALVEGDIARPGLGLDEAGRAALADADEVWHLAAVYDLEVSESVAVAANVEGTRHVLAFCGTARRLVHFSTAYVAGARTGLVREDELDAGQKFKNRYEATKFRAEVLVREAAAGGLRAVILRPGIVVGDSRTGETDKFDGPYHAFRSLRQMGWLPLGVPTPGRAAADMNIVPVDWVVEAALVIARRPDADGRTFHLVDPAPLSARQAYELWSRLALGRPPAPWTIPAGLVWAAVHLGLFRKLIGVSPEFIVYLNHEVRFDAANTRRALEGSGLALPCAAQLMPVMYEYWKRHHRAPKAA